MIGKCFTLKSEAKAGEKNQIQVERSHTCSFIQRSVCSFSVASLIDELANSMLDDHNTLHESLLYDYIIVLLRF